ncbi:hypothetical protein IAT38_006154 [Cryptococcus sp. DSM 104549]
MPTPLGPTISSSSDEPIAIDPPPLLSRQQSAFSRNKSAPSASRLPARKANGKSKVLVSSDDDEPVFVSSSLGGLAEKYRFKEEEVESSRAGSAGSAGSKAVGRARTGSEAGAGRAASRSASTAPPTKAKAKAEPKPRAKAKKTAKPTTEFPLFPDLGLEPEPVPAWLGKTAVLLQLQACAVCKVRWKGKESGAARWRHMSTCRPPLYRPPNPPPDLQQLIHAALSARTVPTSLLDLHVRALSDTVPSTSTPAPTKPGKSAPKARPTSVVVNGLASVTNVKAAEEREGWGEEVRSRVSEWIGPSSPAGSLSGSDEVSPRRRSPRVKSGSPSPEVMFPATQPMGESSLAYDYSKHPLPSRSSSPSRTLSSPRRSPSPPVRIRTGLDEILVPASDSEEDDPPPAPQKRYRASPTPEPGEIRMPQGISPERSGGVPSLSVGDKDLYLGSGDEAHGVGRGADLLPKREKVVLDDTDNEDVLKDDPTADVPSTFSRMSLTPHSSWEHDRSRQKSESLTPRGPTEGRKRERSLVFTPSPTPTRSLMPYPHDSPMHVDTGYIPNTWGGDAWDDEAIMSWEGVAGPSRDDDDDDGMSASSVPPDDEERDPWEKAARAEVAWEDEPVEETEEEEEELEEEEEERPEETREELLARGMPDYETWDVKKLQKLTTGYGYRSVKVHKSLVKIAETCWKALNPREGDLSPAERLAKMIERGKKRAEKMKGAEKADPGAKAKGKGKGKEDLTPFFHDLIRNDGELYLRILRYEPISFDELISKALAAGVTKRGWKSELKRFLDLQSITYFTEDPTMQRRRR